MAKKKNAGRQNITLECVEQRTLMKQGNTDNKGVSRYVTQKNKKNTSERLELRKYNPFLRRHTIHKEIK